MSPIRRTREVKRDKDRPLHARLGFVAVTTTLVVATVGVTAAALGQMFLPRTEPIPTMPARVQAGLVVRDMSITSPDLSTCDRFAVITNIIDCGIFNPEDAQSCTACKISGR
ncbi:MAG: hypothetical protein V1745_02430 [Patescibacteria group bacterium]